MLTDLHATLSAHVLAYIGPGAGLGGLLVLIALVLGGLFLVFGLVWYPLKRVLKGRAGGTADDTRTVDAE